MATRSKNPSETKSGRALMAARAKQLARSLTAARLALFARLRAEGIASLEIKCKQSPDGTLSIAFRTGRHKSVIPSAPMGRWIRVPPSGDFVRRGHKKG